MAKAEHAHLPEHAAEPAPPDTGNTPLARGAFMQHLHALVNSYAEMWDEGRSGAETEPTTEKTWLADFEKYLQKH